MLLSLSYIYSNVYIYIYTYIYIHAYQENSQMHFRLRKVLSNYNIIQVPHQAVSLVDQVLPIELRIEKHFLPML